MSEQPEALRLADRLGRIQPIKEAQQTYLDEAADELRRLHEVNTELLHWMKYMQAQTHLGHIHDTAIVAVAKATGEQQ